MAFTDELPGRPAYIFAIDVAGLGPPEQVSVDCVQPACIDDHFPAYSPDGRQLALARIFGPEVEDHPRDSGIGILDLATKRFRQVTSVSWFTNEDKMPHWSPNGAHLLFTRTAHDAATDTPTGSALFIIDSDGRNLRQVTATELHAGEGDWSPDGTRIVFSTHPLDEYPDAGDQELYTIAPNGANLTRLTAGHNRGIASASPRWTPQGAILFTRLEKGTLGDLWTMAGDGTQLSAVSSDRMHRNAHATWRPDGAADSSGAATPACSALRGEGRSCK